MINRTSCLLGLLLGATTTFAHIDTLVQVLEPDPLVKSFEAESLPGIGTAKVIDDKAATGGKAVVLTGEGAGLKLDFGRLGVGIHCVYVTARLSDVEPFVQGPTARESKPLYLHLKVNSAPGGGIEEFRMRVPLPEGGLYEHIAHIYFHTTEERAYTAEVFLGPRSAIREVVVDRVELRNPLGGFDFKALKTKRTLYTDAEAAQWKATAAKAKKVYPPIRSAPLPAEERARLDDIIWNHATMPINANVGNSYLLSLASPKVNDHYKVARTNAQKSAGREIGGWETLATKDAPHTQPWTLTNKTLGLAYTMADYRAGRPLPSPWPFPEDNGGFFYDKDQWGSAASFNLGLVPTQVGSHQAAISRLLYPNEGDTSQSLPDRFLLSGDTEAAADGALLLVAWAYRFPAYDYKKHSIDNIYFAGKPFKTGTGYGRGPSGQWSGPEYVRLCHAYDKLFPYIQGNAEFARRVGRFVPWVKSPDDVIKLIDTFLVQRGAQDGVQHVMYAQTTMPVSAAVLGPNPTSERILDTYFRQVYLRNTLCGFLDTVLGGYSRDGLNYIGSTYYVSFESKDELFEVADLLGRYVEAGGAKRFAIADRYPRLRATADSILRLHTAGWYWTGVGDVGSPTAAPRAMFDEKWGDFFLSSYRMTKDPRLAWVLVNRLGQGTCPDKEWQEIVKAAATTRDPLLHTESNVLEGYGTATLEEGSDATDLRHKNAAMLRFGVGSGHAHPDTLDLEVYAHGVRMSADFGGRVFGTYGKPSCMSALVHNLVQVDEKDFNGGPQNSTAIGWLDAFKPLPGAQYVGGSARAETHPHVSVYSRGVLQVLCDAGNGADVTPSAYVFDVFRVDGGRTHTWNFHGAVSEEFTTNAGLKPAESDLAKKYLETHLKGSELEGTAPAILEATWKLRRKEEVVDGIQTANAEKTMLGALYDEKSPEKFTKVHLVGHEGDKVLVGNYYANQLAGRHYNFPLLHVRKDGDNLASVYPAIIEPYAGKPFVSAVRALPVTDAGDGADRPVALEVKTTFGQTDFLFSSLDRQKSFAVDGGRASGNVAFVSEDANGLRQLSLVGGTELARGRIAVKIAKPEYRARIESVDYGARRIVLSEPLPGKLLDGEILRIGNKIHQTTYKANRIDGAKVDLDRDSAVYQGGVAYVDPSGSFVELDLAPYLFDYHPSYYEGMTAVNEAGKILGKITINLGDRYFFTGWPEVRRHLNRIDSKDLADANGDGKTTVAMIATQPQQKLAADGTTLIEVKPGEKMLDLDVTRLREDGLMLFTKQHPREFVDALKDPHPGWPYDQQIIRNEKGDREWVVNMPGDTYQMHLTDGKIAGSDLPDPNKDGRKLVVFHDYGPGDDVVLATHAQLRRIEPNVFELRANAACTITLPGKAAAISRDGGKTWSDLKANAREATVTLALRESDLGDGVVRLKITP